MVYLKKITLRRILPLVLKSGVLVAVMTFIYVKFENKARLQDEFLDIATPLLEQDLLPIGILLFLLMLINWLLETCKWWFLARKVHPIRFSEALGGVLAGLSLSFITPHALGDYAARIWHSPHQGRERMLGALFLGRWLQLWATLLFGIWGTYVLVNSSHLSAHIFILIVSFMLLIPVVMAIIKKQLPLWSQSQWKILRLAFDYLAVIIEYTSKELLIAFGLAVLRYIVFSLQFLLVLRTVGLPLPWHTLYAAVTWVLLAKSVLPTFNFLSDLGIREFSILYFFEGYAVSEVRLVLGSLLVWLLNIVFPTIAGLPFMFKMKIIRNPP